MTLRYAARHHETGNWWPGAESNPPTRGFSGFVPEQDVVSVASNRLLRRSCSTRPAYEIRMGSETSGEQKEERPTATVRKRAVDRPGRPRMLHPCMPSQFILEKTNRDAERVLCSDSRRSLHFEEPNQARTPSTLRINNSVQRRRPSDPVASVHPATPNARLPPKCPDAQVFGRPNVPATRRPGANSNALLRSKLRGSS